jgi:hypothetical protein
LFWRARGTLAWAVKPARPCLRFPCRNGSPAGREAKGSHFAAGERLVGERDGARMPARSA